MKLSSVEKAQELKYAMESNRDLTERVRKAKRLVLGLDDGYRDGIWVDVDGQDGKQLQAIFERILARRRAEIEDQLKALGVEL
jgi:uncharacterized protein (DUF58 family)